MLFTYTAGESTATAIIFLHGTVLSGRISQPQMESLTDYYCLAMQLERVEENKPTYNMGNRGV